MARRVPFPALKGYRLTTAEIVYHMPDYPSLLQTYLWQFMDIAPSFPSLCKFLDYWQRCLDGKIHSVTVAQKDLTRPQRLRFVDSTWTLH